MTGERKDETERGRLLRNISANTLQVLGNQCLGVFIFLLLSRYLDKPSFGELSWCLAVLSFITTLLSLRLEQIVVRNVAAGEDPSAMLSLFAAHNFVIGTLFFAGLTVVCQLSPSLATHHNLLWLLSFSQLLTFWALPFRQILTGCGEWGWLALLASLSNLARAIGLYLCVRYSVMNLTAVASLFGISSLLELLAGWWIVRGRLKIPFHVERPLTAYRALLLSSLPQIGVVFLNAGIARMDWILLGLMSTPTHTAEYSFAYRAFEFAPLPLLVLAPFLLNRFSRGQEPDAEWLSKLVRAEMVMATLPALWLVLMWTPMVDAFTGDKYGRSNQMTFLILSCCSPLLYFINLYWSHAFARDQLGRIFRITAMTAAVMLAGDLVLIPLYAGAGAACAYVLAIIVQFALYARVSSLGFRREWAVSLGGAVAIASCAGAVAFAVTDALLGRLAIATGLYGGLAWASIRLKGWWKRIDWPLLLFLLLFLNVKLYIKLAAIIIAMILTRGDWRTRERGPLKWWMFYSCMLLLALLNFLFTFPSLPDHASLAFAMGCGYWILAMLASRQIVLFVQRGDMEKMHASVSSFFLINAGVMAASALRLCLEAGVVNPYNYEGEHRKYFISTGDRITGIGLDSSVTAALIGAFGVLYFLYRGRNDRALICFVTTLLATSNAVSYMLLIVLVIGWLMYSTRLQKSMIIVSFLLVVIFAAKVSPSNHQYAGNLVGRIAGKNAYEEPVPIPNAKWDQFVESRKVVLKEAKMQTVMGGLYTTAEHDSLKALYQGWNLSGRRIGWEQLARFFRQHPWCLWTGTGMGNFSSQLAFRTTGLGVAGNYPASATYIHPFFKSNHLFIYLYYHGRDEGQHSVINKPDSVYAQMLGEYGLVGLACLFIFYLYYLGGHIRWKGVRSYGLPLLLLMAGAFFTEYWFEQLSMIILFQLLMLLDKRACLQRSPY